MCRIWPMMMSHVIGLHDSGHTAFDGSRYGDYALAALIETAQVRSTTSTAKSKTSRLHGGNRWRGNRLSSSGCPTRSATQHVLTS